MAAFDLNSLYFLKNAAPKTTSFEEAIAPMKTGFDLGTAYNENYNKNSLQNLIAQRESEGIPFDRISNEAAKYDLNAANSMRDERRKSLDYNYKQSVSEFENWRKNMARRICGLILQKADELGMAPDQVYGVLDAAAHYVVTYDEQLAEFLMQQANTRRYNSARTAPKMQNQDESKLYPSEISSRKAKANDVDFAGANRFLGTYQNNSANVGAMLTNLYSTGKLPYLKKAWIDGVTQFAMNSDPSTFKVDSIWNNDTVLKAIDLFMNNGTPEQVESVSAETVMPSSVVKVPKVINGTLTNNPPKEDDYSKTIRSYYIPGNAISGTRENLNVSRIDSDLKKYYDNLEALQYMVGVLSQDNQRFAGVKGDAGANSENGVVKVNREKVQKRIDELKELERGGFTPETAKALKLSGKTGQTLSDEIARWQRIPKIIDAYYQNPGAILPPLVRTLLPEERTTDEDVKRIIKSDLGEDGYNKLFNAIAATDKNILGSLLSKEAFANAVRKVAPIIMNNMKKEYNALVKANNGDSKKVDNALREAYRYDDDVIDYVKGNKILFTVKKYYDKEADRIKKERERKEKEAFEKSNGGSGNAKSAKYTEADWDNF